MDQNNELKFGEIFQAIAKNTSLLVRGYLVRFGSTTMIIDAVQNDDIWQVYFVEPESVCRCTELRDKFNILLFENDIVKMTDVNDVLLKITITDSLGPCRFIVSELDSGKFVCTLDGVTSKIIEKQDF